jgi:hypothetical protein
LGNVEDTEMLWAHRSGFGCPAGSDGLLIAHARQILDRPAT